MNKQQREALGEIDHMLYFVLEYISCGDVPISWELRYKVALLEAKIANLGPDTDLDIK